MKIKARLESPRIDFASYNRQLALDMGDLITFTATEWITAAIELIPVWSGASHATFLNLAREAGFQLSVNNESGVPNRVSLGQATSSGRIDIKAEQGQFSFEYETSLIHLNQNEREFRSPANDPFLSAPLKKPGPYNFRERARDVAVRTLMRGELPNLLQHMTIKRIRRG